MLSLNEFCIALFLMERHREGHSLPKAPPSGILFERTSVTIVVILLVLRWVDIFFVCKLRDHDLYFVLIVYFSEVQANEYFSYPSGAKEEGLVKESDSTPTCMTSVKRRGSAGVVETLMLLKSHDNMHAPFTQDPPIMTEDMHEERLHAVEVLGDSFILHYLETVRQNQLEQMVCTAFRAAADTLNQTRVGGLKNMTIKIDQLYFTIASALKPLQANKLPGDMEIFQDVKRLCVVFEHVEKLLTLGSGSGNQWSHQQGKIGDHNSLGIIPLAIKDVFSIIQDTPGREFLFPLSYIEIYNEDHTPSVDQPLTESKGITVEKDVLEQSNSQYELQGEYVFPGSLAGKETGKGNLLRRAMAGYLGSVISSMGRWRMRLEILRPELEQIKQEMQDRGMSPSAVAKGQEKMKKVFKEHGVSTFTPLKGLFIQGPVFVSFFLAIQNMVEKVPSFQNGSISWFIDLTTVDTFYILPCLTAFSFWITIQVIHIVVYLFQIPHYLDGEKGHKNYRSRV
ncbi:unnamed protein product [Lactuca virosa]|uniref:Rab3 GTPase-activating protein catalytic subunit n=1 Tax=Lactuca virosa TaxID=75947 RepID=A0AAU9PDH8_9ASTR|nr:unnamed protein product [Lactuca virosa]